MSQNDNAASGQNPLGSPVRDLSTDTERLDGYDAQAQADDETEAPEEESQSQIPGDPRKPNEQQPPFREQN